MDRIFVKSAPDHRLIFFALMFALIATALTLSAQAHAQSDSQGQTVYGWELMSPEERVEHQRQMREAKTVEERQQIQAAHRDKMQQRATERGVKLPCQGVDCPRGPGRGGSGAGMGPGKGAGQGKGMGQPSAPRNAR
ncbi:MAG: hypothetical protein OQK53_08880 [Rhodospirillales bacterium]|nr:hypothetical protein [Rhodospirillales bacterium]